jgi:hypothetical protein
MKLKGLILVVVLSLTACNGTLYIYDDEQNEVKGVPFRMPEAYLKTGIHNMHSRFGSECAETNFSETVVLSTGDLYYLTFPLRAHGQDSCGLQEKAS